MSVLQRLIDTQTDSKLPLRAAILACSAYTCSYVGSLYLFQAARTSTRDTASQTGLTRDHPQVIKARLLAVSTSSLLSLGLSAYLIQKHSRPALFQSSSLEWIRRVLGLAMPRNAVTGTFYPLLLTATLFLGPIYTAFLDRCLPFQSDFSFEVDVKQKFGSWIGLRNFCMGPITEELVFRSCIIATSVLAGISNSKLIWLSPLYFGLAHAHHAWDVYCNHGRTRGALFQGVVGSTFQFCYTTIFGWYSSFLFLRSASIVPPLISHVFCNIMGFPQLPSALSSHPNRKISIWTAYLLGIAGFTYQFTRWTAVRSVFGGSLFWN